MKYKILEERIVFDNFFKIKKAKIKHDLFDSTSIEVERLCFERGNSVAILIYEKDSDSFLFTNQFRYPTTKDNNGWIYELPAGSIEGNEEASERAREEVKEEIGYELNNLEFINSFYVSPGGTSEKIFLFYAEVDSINKKYEGGGLKYENEDIELVKIQKTEILNWIKTNKIIDAKTIIGLQWYVINKMNINV